MTWQRKARFGVAGLAALAVVVAMVPGVRPTNASWVDAEWDAATLGSLRCSGNTDLSSRATGRMVTGMLSGTSLDGLVGITGLEVINDGTSSSAISGTPSATSLGSDAFHAPLSAAVASAIFAGGSVSLPLNNGVGVYEQWAQAHDTGVSTGASGAITNTGFIDTGAIAGGTAPTAGRLTLSSLPLVGAPLSGLTDVVLNIGAVASSATLDGCSLAWTGGAPTASQLQRDYRISTLNAQLTSAAVRALFGPTGTVPTLVSGAQTQVTNLFGTVGATGTAEAGIAGTALTSLTGAVSTALSSINVLGISVAVGTGSTTSTTIQLDMSTATSLATGTLVEPGGAISVDLASGVVTVDVEKLAVGGLNGRLPNTSVLTTAQLADVATRVSTLLTTRIAAITAALQAALATATVSVQTDVKVAATVPIVAPSGINALNVHMGYTGTLAQFAAGTQTVSGPTVTILSGTGIGGALLNPVLSALTTNLGTASAVTTSVVAAVVAQAYTPISATISTAQTTAATAAGVTASALDSTLAALSSILSVTLNSQPDQTPFPNEPADAVQAGEYFVSALRIGVLDAPAGAPLLDLFLASSSVGSNAV